MQDVIQQGLHTLAVHNAIVREIMILCASLLVYVMCAAWALIAGWQWRRITVATVARIAMTAVVAGILAKALAQVIIDQRPYLTEHSTPLITVSADNGFPSDHVLLAAVLAAGLWWLGRRYLWPFALATLLVMLGRLAVGAHHTLDVAGSVVIVTVAALAAGMTPLPAAWQRPVLNLLRRETR